MQAARPSVYRLLPPNDGMLPPNDSMLPPNDGLLPANEKKGYAAAACRRSGNAPQAYGKPEQK